MNLINCLVNELAYINWCFSLIHGIEKILYTEFLLTATGSVLEFISYFMLLLAISFSPKITEFLFGASTSCRYGEHLPPPNSVSLRYALYWLQAHLLHSLMSSIVNSIYSTFYCQPLHSIVSFILVV